ncbi:MAG TPA: FHA domain-containing protein [Myxococcaceae bacterium]|nr:FHA domain-containing protein [Myxococcaceae bacterium]
MVAGLPFHALELERVHDAILLRGDTTVEVDGMPLSERHERLLLPGEVVTWGDQLHLTVLAPERHSSAVTRTRHLLQSLLRGESPGSRVQGPSLIGLTGRELGRRFPLIEERTELGRGAEASFQLRDKSVSRKHARLQRLNGTFLLEDLGSPNGVKVNGRRVHGAHYLRDGEVIALGYTLLKYRFPPLAAATLPAQTPPPTTAAPVARFGRLESWMVAFFLALATWGLSYAGGWEVGP